MEAVHDKGIVYRDVKPENFVVGRKSAKKNNRIYLIGDERTRIDGRELDFRKSGKRKGWKLLKKNSAHIKQWFRRHELFWC